MKKKILILALLGDPTLPAGVSYTGGFNQTLREFLVFASSFEMPIYVITDTSIYRQEAHTIVSSNIELFRVFVNSEEHLDQERLRDSQDRILYEIYNILDKDISNIALIHSFYWFSGHLAKRIHEQYHIPYIHTPISLAYYKTITGHEANCPFQIECEIAFLEEAERVLAITEQEAKILSYHYQLDRDKIVVTGRSVDAIFHDPVRNYNGTPRGTVSLENTFPFTACDAPWWTAGAFLYLGRMVPIKGLLQIVQAWDKLRKQYGAKTPPLWLVGGSAAQIAKLREELLEDVENLPVYEMQHEIIWWGYLDQASISALFLKSLVLVTHSRFEAGGRVILEAMCQGRPVIATPNGFAADYIRDWKNGFLVSYGDCDGLTRCMEYFVRQPYLACALGNAAKLSFQQIEQQWNYVEVHRNLYEFYITGTQLDEINCETPEVPIQFAVEWSNKVDIFPYFDINLSEEEWRREVTAKFKRPATHIKEISMSDSNARHYIFESGGNCYRIKQFYSRWNRDVIWNDCEDKKVLANHDRFQNAIYSQRYYGVCDIVFSSAEYMYYILPDLRQEDFSYESISHLLDNFSISVPRSLIEQQENQEFQHNTYMCTLELMIDTLEVSSRKLESDLLRNLLAHLPEIRTLEKASRDDVRLGVNYGKSLSGHVVIYHGNPVLLPCCDWYLGELGPDYINVALWMKKEIRALSWQKNSIRQHLWLLCIAWRKIVQTEWNRLTPTPFWRNTILYALKILRIF